MLFSISAVLLHKPGKLHGGFRAKFLTVYGIEMK
jgi:hypothetical protein